MSDILDTSVRISDDLSPLLAKAGFDDLHAKAKGGSDAQAGLNTLSAYSAGLVAGTCSARYGADIGF
jgi:hypothetical protein